MADTTVKLKSQGVIYEFTISHAQKVLNSRNNKLVKGKEFVLDDEKFELDASGNIIRRRKNKGDSTESASQKAD